MNAWKCDVCGYVHRGASSPASCIICAATAEHFSPLTVTPGPVAKPTGSRWRCTICDHVHTGSQPPERCTICAAAANMFAPVTGEAVTGGDARIRNILILGAGIAGITAAEEARKYSDRPNITLISKEPGLPYYRLNLTRFLAGEVTEQELPLQPASWFAEKNITLTEGEALHIDRSQKQVVLRDGRTFPYDKLVLTNGSHPFVPPLPGATREGVLTLRTLSDARQILTRLQPGLRVACIGGGLLGLETAAALNRRGARVTILEGNPWLMPRQLPQPAASQLQQQLEKVGIEVICGAQIQELAGDEHLHAVLLADNREIPAELVVIATGVRPNSCLARQAALKVKTGLLVDDRMTSNDPDILAAGDLTEHRGQLYGIWPASYAQGVVAGINAAGGNVEFSGLSQATRIKVVAAELYSVGQLSLVDASYRLLESTGAATYCGLVCHDNQLVGAALFGDTSLAGELKEAIESGRQLQELPQLLERFPQLLERFPQLLG